MRGYHWGFLILVLAIGYLLGIYMPGWGNRFRAMIGK
jgi:hypothetical protein